MLSVPSFLLVMIENDIPIRIISTFVISYSCIKRKSSSQSSLYFGYWLVKGNTTCQLSTSCEIISFGIFQFCISFEFLNWFLVVQLTCPVKWYLTRFLGRNGIWQDFRFEMVFGNSSSFQEKSCQGTVGSFKKKSFALRRRLHFRKIFNFRTYSLHILPRCDSSVPRRRQEKKTSSNTPSHI